MFRMFRLLLRAALAGCLAVLAACANRPVEPVLPLAKVGLIETQMNAKIAIDHRNAGGAGAAVDLAAAAAFRAALADRKYDPRMALHDAVVAALDRAGVAFERVDSRLSRKAYDDDDFAFLPGDTPAYVVVNLRNLEFRAFPNGEYQPYVYVSMWIPKRSNAASLAETGYAASFGQAKGDKRFFEAPRSWVYPKAGDFTARTEVAIEVLDKSFAEIAQRLAADVKLRMSGKQLED